jgi:signal transduction histidine kinase
MNPTPTTASILAVDDDAKSLLAMQEMLQDMPLNVVTASSGDEALRRVLKENFALILMDARMPGMDGFETARLIRERELSRHTPIIFLTGAYEDVPSMQRGYEAGAVDYIVKPPRPEVLKSKISVFVDLHRKNAKLIQEIIERRRVEENLKSSRENLRALAVHMQSVREEESVRIAREIHDQLGQALTALKMDLIWIANRAPADQSDLREKSQSMLSLIDDTIKSVGEITARLRPTVLDELGLVAAIGWQAGDFQRRSGIRCNVSLPEEPPVLDRDRSTAAFRIFQELLTNVARHAGATRVDVSVKPDRGAFVLTVEDNGVGIDSDAARSPKSLGLTGIRERALPFGGSVDIAGDPGQGTRVRVTIPRPEVIEPQLASEKIG